MKTITPSCYRQGDVLLVRVPSLPEGAVPVKGNVVQLGEISGHHHVLTQSPLPQAFEQTNATLFEFEGQTFAAVGSDGSFLQHVNVKTAEKAEHNTLPIDEGFYKVIIERDYNPYTKVIERARD